MKGSRRNGKGSTKKRGASRRPSSVGPHSAGSTEHIAPKKGLGQNFLIDRNVADRIVEAFAPAPDEPVIEIGPGEGVLTGRLVERGARVIAVELDPRAAAMVRERYGGKVEVIEQDVLTLSIREVAREREIDRIRVIGNIPYYITTPILFHLIDHRDVVAEAILMMQREVAERLTAEPRTKAYGILSVMTQSFGDPKRLFNVPPGCFYPPPKVTSTVVRIGLHDDNEMRRIERPFRRLVRTAFGKRRKTLSNSLAEMFPDVDERIRIFREAEIEPNQRAEELSPERFRRFARIFADARAGGAGREAPRDDA